jgi:LacI family transcriptional regulator
MNTSDSDASKQRLSRLTIKDIAAIAGVSPATVSLALNGSPLVAAETAKYIKKLANKHEYRSNAIARRLSKGCSEVVTLFILGDREDQAGWLLASTWIYVSPIIKGAGLTLSSLNYNLQFEVLAGNEADNLKRIMNTINENSADGILIFAHDEIGCSLWQELEKADLPIVFINANISPGLSSVEIDNYQGAQDAVNYLLGLGHTKIAHISGPYSSINAKERLNGYLDTLKKAGIDPRPEYILKGDWRIDSGSELMHRLLELNEFPSAVFCANDHMAFGAMKALHSKGIPIPESVSLIGFDDCELSEAVSPTLTSVRQPLEEIGRIAAEEIIRYIQKKSDQTVRHIVIPTKLIARQSCGRIS